MTSFCLKSGPEEPARGGGGGAERGGKKKIKAICDLCYEQ